MMKSALMRVAISVGIYLSATTGVVAGWFGTDFSAETYQISAEQQVPVGKMYVSEGRVRTEMAVQGRQMVEIINPQKGRAWLLDPTTKTYQERPVAPQPADTGQGNPCQGQQVSDCRLVGEEPVNGRPAKKWHFTFARQTRTLWLDSQHHFPVMAAIDGKTVMAMRFLGEEMLAGRRVEKWEAREMSPDGSMVSLQWYDPQLNVAIRQQVPSGESRELRNIRLGKQPDGLFELPADYRPATIPQ